MHKATIDEHAAKILQNATHTVETILARRAQLDNSGHKNQPLAVVGGELHDEDEHTIHHLLVAKGLQESGQIISFNYEFPHNLLESIFSSSMRHKPSLNEKTYLKDMDDAGILTLKASLGHLNYLDNSYHMLGTFLLQRGIKSFFTDAPSAHLGFLDTHDLSTSESLRASSSKNVKFVFTMSSLGMKTRNHHMASLAVAHARKNNAKIIYQSCGMYHVLGAPRFLSGSRNLAKDSLSAKFKEQGAAVLGVMPFKIRLPIDYEAKAEEILFLQPSPYLERRARDSAWERKGEQVNYINDVLKRCGLASNCLSLDGYKAQKKLYKRETEEIFVACKADTLSMR